jgi:hypothetical protein
VKMNVRYIFLVFTFDFLLQQPLAKS